MPQPVLIAPRAHDLGGGFTVRRVLPTAQRQAVGPFLFFDHFGPVTAGPDDNHDVRPHPHIGLATVTYLFEGAMMHRDSTGVVQRIEPGAINWMTAGRGIVHSERTPDDLRGQVRTSHGVQLWAALPLAHEDDAPSFAHTPASAIPQLQLPQARVRVLIGSAFAVSPTLYLDIQLQAGASLTLPALAEERAIYSVDNDFLLDGSAVSAHTLAVLADQAAPVLQAVQDTRLVLVGGAPLGHRFMVWNFVASRKERIVQAQLDWQAQRFEPVPGEREFVPLPQVQRS
jgi:redox-sensitive bicupin YhaK (pirin superfamily)